MPQAAAIVTNEKHALLVMAITYFGASLLGYRYGVYIKDAIDTTLTRESDTAFFSGVWPSVAETQPKITELTLYTPDAKRKHAM